MNTVNAPTDRQSRFRLVWLVIAILPVLYYVGTVVWYAYDFPYMDDYLVLVQFLAKLPGASMGERWQLLLEQNNFHRVIWVKGIAWGYYALTGTVNFTFLQLLGNSALLLTAWLLFRGAKRTVITLIPALYLLFQFQSWNNAFWAMAAMSNFWAPAWALLAFYLAFQQRQLGWSLVVAMLALLTNGNGILVLPLLATGFALQKQYRPMAITLVVMVIGFVFYFIGYQNPAGIAISDLLTPARIAHLLALNTAFLGAMFYHPAVAWLSQVVGWATICWTIYLLVTRYDRQQPVLFWLLVFLHLTGLMLATNRIENSLEIVFASRYRNISALMLATTYLTVADIFIRQQLRFQQLAFSLALAGAIGINVISNITYQSKIARFRELRQTDQLLWQQFGQIRACAAQYQPVEWLNRLASQGTFQPQPQSLSALASHLVPLKIPVTNTAPLTYAIDIKQADAGYLVVSGWANIQGQKANFNDTYLGVQVDGQWQFYSTLFHQRLDKDNATDKDTGFTGIIPLSAMRNNANLPLAILVRSGKKQSFAAIALNEKAR